MHTLSMSPPRCCSQLGAPSLQVDCVEHQSFCNKQMIRAYPTLRMYKDVRMQPSVHKLLLIASCAPCLPTAKGHAISVWMTRNAAKGPFPWQLDSVIPCRRQIRSTLNSSLVHAQPKPSWGSCNFR